MREKGLSNRKEDQEEEGNEGSANQRKADAHVPTSRSIMLIQSVKNQTGEHACTMHFNLGFGVLSLLSRWLAT